MLKKNSLVSDVRQVISFMKTSGVRVRFFISSLLLSLGLTLFTLYTVSLLFPLTQGIIKGDFNNVKSLKIIGFLVKSYPSFFSTSTRLFILLVVWVYATIIVKNVLQYGAFLSTQYQAKVATIKLRNILLDKCLSFSKAFYDSKKITDIYTIVTKSTSVIENQFTLFQNLIIQLFLLSIYLVTMIHISLKLTIISMISFPLVNILTRKVTKKIKETLKASERASINLNDKVMNLLYCMPIVKGFAKEEIEKELFALASKEELDQSFNTQKVSNLLNPIEDIGSTTSILLLALGMALLVHIDHSIDPSGAFVFFYLAQKIIPVLNAINNFSLGMVNSSKAVDDINDLLNSNNSFVIENGKIKFKNIEQGIEIKNMTFAYNTALSPALNNFSLYIPKGKITAIVGATGSGKSTIANLLLRFYDCPPESIFIDDVDIKNFDISSLRQKISFVSQDILLFSSTVGENISYSSHNPVEQEHIENISKKAEVHTFIDKMPEKYSTKVAERGGNFSGGERQRISIARAFLKEYEIFIMDEATSALDANTEAKIMEAAEELFVDKTVIVISHRLSTIRKADHIVFIDKGIVKESGSLAELLALQGLFYKQWQAQKL